MRRSISLPVVPVDDIISFMFSIEIVNHSLPTQDRIGTINLFLHMMSLSNLIPSIQTNENYFF
jgi:hypothetical protein